MNFIEKLISTAEQFNSIICLGMDPVLEDIPETGSVRNRITVFYESILKNIMKEKVYPSAVKPNYAFYAQYGMEGIDALCRVIDLYSREGFPVILDVKRGDIGKTGEAYAREAFQFFKADAVTLSPYMGYDSIEPFIKNKPEAGYYILTKTSNKSSGDIQDISAQGEPIFVHTARKILQWYHPGIGAVVGATYPEELRRVSDIFIQSGKDVPLLIPGVGSQGGSIDEVVGELKRFREIRIHRINSSSAINYAYKKYTGLHYADAAVKALKKLNDEIII